MLLNYVANAVKFTETGSVRIRVAPEDGGRLLRFCVTDTGIGIPPERHGALFEGSARLDQFPSRRHGGAGLGLALTKQLAALMGGSVGVSSLPGLGSSFWFDLPLPADPAPLPAPAPLSADDRRPRVLVAEDNRTNQLVIRAMLERLGCEVEMATNGAEAVTAATSRAFDLILMDIMMPEMDGVEATQRLRAHGLTLPIVALTANADGGDHARYRASGMDDCLVKPVRGDTLRATMRALLPGMPALSA
jgi:CheY-like chemotaxis protein